MCSELAHVRAEVSKKNMNISNRKQHKITHPISVMQSEVPLHARFLSALNRAPLPASSLKEPESSLKRGPVQTRVPNLGLKALQNTGKLRRAGGFVRGLRVVGG